MKKPIDEVKSEIYYFKKELTDLWQSKGETDQEILDLAEKIDKLMNEYDHLSRYSD